jgi:hypothetical protein
MKPGFRSFCAALLCAVSLAAGLAVVPNEVVAQSKPGAVAMPSNYRELIARYMLAMKELDQKTLRTAKISRPYAKSAGIFGGAPIPTVCVSIWTSNMLGMQFTGYFQFTIRNGRAERLPTANAIFSAECGAFSPFYEVRKG